MVETKTDKQKMVKNAINMNDSERVMSSRWQKEGDFLVPLSVSLCACSPCCAFRMLHCLSTRDPMLASMCAGALLCKTLQKAV